MNEIEKIIAGQYKNHVLPFLWMKGESHDILKEYIQKIYESDIREICVESRPHPDFVGEQWWADMECVIKECKKLGMKIWILDDCHFPTGFANGKIKDYPQFKKELLIEKTYDVVGPQKGVTIRIKNDLKQGDRFYGAILIHNHNYLDITSQVKNDNLYIDLRDSGLYKIIILSITHQTGFRDDYINVIDQNSSHLLIQEVYEKHYEHFHDEFGKTIIGFFSDEPGFMNEKGHDGDSLIGKEMPLPWSEELERKWQKTFQEDYRIALSKLFIRTTESYLERYTYMDIVTKLYQKNFDMQIGEWCRDHDVMHIGHVIEDKECHTRLGVGAGHYFRALAGQDMAGVDIVINQLVPGMDSGFHQYGRGQWDMQFFNYALAKLGSSLGHIDPLKKGRTIAEVFGAFGWHEGLKLMKWIIDHFLVRGVNYFVPHAFSQANFPDFDCPPHFYAQGNNHQFPYFKQLMTYTNQMATLLSDGKPVLTAAILYHGEAEWCGDCMKIQIPAEILTKNQIDFDFVCCDTFKQHNQYQFSDGQLSLCQIHYQCLIIPYMEYISEDFYLFLQKAKAKHFPVFFISRKPRTIIETGKDFIDEDLGKTVLLGDLITALKKEHLFDIQISSYQPWLRFSHYQKNHEDYYMFFNEHPKEVITTRINNIRGIQYDILNHNQKIFNEELILYPYESCIIMPTHISITKECEKKEWIIENTWELSFKNHKSSHQYISLGTIQELVDLNQYYPTRSGTYKYETIIRTDQLVDCQLQIEDAYETVHLYIDDKDMKSRICPPYHFHLGNLSQGSHKLVIEVLNTLDKTINDIFSNSEIIEPSGIIGQVKLVYQKENNYGISK